MFGGFAGFGIGNMVQSTASRECSKRVRHAALDTGIVLAGLTGFVLLGGIKRIGAVAESLVPAMCSRTSLPR